MNPWWLWAMTAVALKWFLICPRITFSIILQALEWDLLACIYQILPSYLSWKQGHLLLLWCWAFLQHPEGQVITLVFLMVTKCCVYRNKFLHQLWIQFWKFQSKTSSQRFLSVHIFRWKVLKNCCFSVIPYSLWQQLTVIKYRVWFPHWTWKALIQVSKKLHV